MFVFLDPSPPVGFRRVTVSPVLVYDLNFFV